MKGRVGAKETREEEPASQRDPHTAQAKGLTLDLVGTQLVSAPGMGGGVVRVGYSSHSGYGPGVRHLGSPVAGAGFSIPQEHRGTEPVCLAY